MSIMTGDLLKQYNISNMSMDLAELQGSSEFIATQKIKLAAAKAPNTVVMCEDVSLCFNAFQGLPGPYM